MQPIRFFLKVVLLFNSCFVAGLLLQIIRLDKDLNGLLKTILVAGYLLALPFNIMLNLIVLGLLLWGKIQYRQLPKGLYVANLLFLLLQTIFFLL